VVVKTNCPIAKILRKPKLAGRMAIEISEFDLQFELKGAIKSQCLADFIVKLQTNSNVERVGVLYVDGSSSKKRTGVGIVLEGPKDMKI